MIREARGMGDQVSRRNAILAASMGLIVISLGAHAAQAGTVYWDINGATVGASDATTAAGTWDQNTTANWTGDTTGASATGTYQALGGAAPDAVFSAGTNATGTYSVAVAGTVNANSLLFEEGAVTLTGASSTIALGSGNAVTAGSNSGTTINTLVTGSNGLNITAGNGVTSYSGVAFGGANTGLSGTVNVGAKIEAGVSNSRGLGSGTVAVTSGGGLYLNNRAVTLSNPVQIIGTGAANRGALRMVQDANGGSTVTGGVTLTGNATITATCGGAQYVTVSTITTGAVNLQQYTATINSVNGARLAINSNIIGTGGITTTNPLLTLGGANTYTGNTNINSATAQLTLASPGSLLFKVTDSASNKITGTGILELDGTLTFDTTAVTKDGSWTLVDTTPLQENYGTTFAVALADGTPFASNNHVWTLDQGGRSYTFTESTGVLSVSVPEPAAMALLGLGALGMMARRRRAQA